jgi:plasmid maintenance system killer protein
MKNNPFIQFELRDKRIASWKPAQAGHSRTQILILAAASKMNELRGIGLRFAKVKDKKNGNYSG